MGDKITALTDLADPQLTDTIAVVDDPSGSPETKEATLGDVLKLVKRPIIIAVGDESTVLSVGTAKVKYRMPMGFTVDEVRASLVVAGTGAALVTVDINENGTSILSTKITIDATEKTSETAATPPVIGGAGPDITDDAEISIDIDVIDTDNVAAGLKVTLIGHET